MEKKTIYLIIAAVILIGAIALWWWMNPSAPEVPENVSGDAEGTAIDFEGDTTAGISQDLQEIDLDETDFQSVDSDLNQL